MIDSKAIKEKARRLGADICGIAPVDRFEDAPKGFHPFHIYPNFLQPLSKNLSQPCRTSKMIKVIQDGACAHVLSET